LYVSLFLSLSLHVCRRVSTVNFKIGSVNVFLRGSEMGNVHKQEVCCRSRCTVFYSNHSCIKIKKSHNVTSAREPSKRIGD